MDLYGAAFVQFLLVAAGRSFQAPDGRQADRWVLVSPIITPIKPMEYWIDDTRPPLEVSGWRMTYGETVDGEPVPHGHVEARSYRMACVEARAFGGDLSQARFV